MGSQALFSNITGSNNIAIGFGALFSATQGNANTAIGNSALAGNTGGVNIAIGFLAGSSATTGNHNIYIANSGKPGDDGVIAIGHQDNQSHTTIAGIRGVTTDIPANLPVLISQTGQLGTVISSRRFKQDIHDMDQASSALMCLRPVTFRYKKAYANGERPLQYGLIAEEVAKVYPELVVYDKAGQTQSVQYHQLPTLLLNKLQKQHRLIQEQERQITNLSGRLSRLEQVFSTAQQTLMR